MSTYHIFISHAWHYGDQYNTVVDWLEESTLFFKNYSVPEHDPVDANNTAKLKAALTEQISHANIVIIISGMYAAHSNWINYETDEAVRMGKTIIALKPRGNERIPLKVQDAADELVNWNSQSLITRSKDINSHSSKLQSKSRPLCVNRESGRHEANHALLHLHITMIRLPFQGGFIYVQDQNQKARKDVLVQLRYVQEPTPHERERRLCHRR